MNGIKKNQQDISEKLLEQETLFKKLSSSLALEGSIPGIFKEGSVSLRWMSLPPRQGVLCWRATVVSKKGGIIGEYGAEDLPFDVWPDILKQEFQRWVRSVEVDMFHRLELTLEDVGMEESDDKLVVSFKSGQSHRQFVQWYKDKYGLVSLNKEVV